MRDSHPKMYAVTAIDPRGGGNTAEIVFHPRRLCGLKAKQRALKSELAQQKLAAVLKCERAISEVEAMRTEDNAAPVDSMIEALRLVLEEVQTLDPLHASTPEIFIKLSDQLQQVLVKFMSAILAARVPYKPQSGPTATP